jgi:hypothetical protein
LVKEVKTRLKSFSVLGWAKEEIQSKADLKNSRQQLKIELACPSNFGIMSWCFGFIE